MNYATSMGFNNVEVFSDEEASAKTADRKELLRMLAYCQAHKGDIDALIVWKIDRFARRTEDHLALRTLLAKQGVRLHSVTENIEDNTTGRLMEAMLAAFAQFDNEVRAERSKNGIHARVEQGGWPYYALLGYVNYKDSLGRPTQKPVSQTASLVTSIFTEFATGNHTQPSIVAYAYEIGLRSRSSKASGKLSMQTIVNMLRNRGYLGQVRSLESGEWIKALHGPLVDEATFLRVQAVLDGRHKKFTIKDIDWPLRAGFTKCSICPSPLTGSAPKGRHRHYPKYSCPTCKTSVIGKPVSVDRDELHKQFEALLINLKPNEGHARLFREVVVKRWNEESKDPLTQRKKCERELEALSDKKHLICDKYFEGHVPNDVKEEQLSRIDTDIAAAKLRLADLSQDTDEKEAIIDFAIDFMTNVSNYWRTALVQIQKRFQNLIFPDGITYEFGKGFGAAKMGVLYEVMQDATSKNSNLVGPAGLEPATNRL